MRRFKRRGEVITTRFSEYEVEMLSSLVSQLDELLSDGVPEQPATDDPFELWAADLQADPDAPEVSEDPVLQRLFPNAYPHDAEASSDFRRFTERDQRQRKISDARVVAEGLAATDGGKQAAVIQLDDASAWLKTLGALRLSLATRLGIDDEEAMADLAALPDDDPRALMYSVFEWLGFAQETLVHCL